MISPSIINEILKVNLQFYQSIPLTFSDTRKYPWRGWDRVFEEKAVTDKNPLSILDLGCGNGRLCTYVKNKLPQSKIHYIGLDFSDKLLEIAKKNIGDTKDAYFQTCDVVNDVTKINGKYDVVCAFGLFHHIPSHQLRITWLKNITNLLNKNGILAISIWNFSKEKKVECPLVSKSMLEPNDYFLGWSGMANLYRYAHLVTTMELADYIRTISNCGLKIALNYIDDRNASSYNSYLVFQKV